MHHFFQSRAAQCALIFSTLFITQGESTAAVGTVVVSGDTNIATGLSGPGNQQFFKNVLHGGHQVTLLAQNVLPTFDPYIVDYYNSLPGVTAVVATGAISAATLAGSDLFVSMIPDDNFTAAEISTLGNFLGAGGSIFFLGENNTAFFTVGNAAINAALDALGSEIRIVPSSMDSGAHSAAGNHIAVNPLTAGISSFVYAATSNVSGGTPLFFDSQQTPFVAYQSMVPEPSPFLLFASGAMGLCFLTRRREPSHGGSNRR